jgi:hypothetical protein
MKVLKATYISGHSINISFSNGENKIVDLAPFLRKAKNPSTSQFLDIKKFKALKLTNGYLTWNGQMDIAADYLYQLPTKKKKKLASS